MRRPALLLSLAGLAAGCVHLQRTDRLDEARAAYDKALRSSAAEGSPADLATAKKWVDLAEAGLLTGDPKVVDDRATVALLKIQAAEALGRTHQLAAQRDHTLEELSATKQLLLDQAQQKLALTRAELEKEKAARDAAEARLLETREAVARETQVQDLPEGTVITLPGGKLFAHGKAELLPGGRDQLARVADFLKTASRAARVEAQPPAKLGRKAALALSGKRAERVREFLVAEGVTADQIRTEPPGQPPARPLPASPEFAANGAVNIVLEPAAQTGIGGGPGRP